MPRTLADDLALDLAQTMLNTEHFAETVTYFPAGGGESRSVTAIVDRGQRLDDAGHHVSELEDCTLHCARSDEDGIDLPTLGDAVRLAGEADPTPKWSFDAVLSMTAESCQLRFTRRRLKHTGQQKPAAY